ncbi:hypothetical protein [Serratia sp. BIGb0163]|uniref:hypothetical protein n=1 Tax=Serratia sp. BIGb0163 TaxID=2940613 RepID=UPI00216824E9|nr:hypothetical protein [Serratia sp. BIGb0163]MCS4266595.1 hypothetical protein [Serratia sp. BIGb0163]
MNDITQGRTTGGLEYGVAVPTLTSTYGIRIPAVDIYLVPVGGTWSYTGKWKSGTVVQSGTFTSANATLCTLSQSDSTLVSGKVCFATSTLSLRKDPNGTEAATASLTLRPIAGANAIAGATNISSFRMATYNSEKMFDYDKPKKIIVAGLTCTLDAGSGQYTFKNGVSPSSTSGQTVGTFTGTDLGITASCAGTNTTNPPITVPVSYVLTPTGPDAVASQGKLIYPTTQKSFYMTFTRDGASTCNASASNVIPLDGTTAAKIDDVKPGQTITKKPVPLGATLCTTGDTTQKPGNYQMAVTASIVSY